jgi:hypothetical protein
MEGRREPMERTDWLEEGFTTPEARFLMVTAITHHRFGSTLWGEEAVRALEDELADIDARAEHLSRDLLETEAAAATGPGPESRLSSNPDDDASTT